MIPNLPILKTVRPYRFEKFEVNNQAQSSKNFDSTKSFVNRMDANQQTI